MTVCTGIGIHGDTEVDEDKREEDKREQKQTEARG